MSRRRNPPPLQKRYVVTYGDHAVYAVDAFAVRCLAQPDEEFDNFATRDEFPNLIPKNEIWLSDRSIDKEGIFFIVDALMRRHELDKGTPEDKAYSAGLKLERELRNRLNGAKFRGARPQKRIPPQVYAEHYITLPDPQFPVNVWLVDGNWVRSLYKTDYTEGGHGYVYRWVPKNEIWIEQDLDRRELPFMVSHEYIELRLMRDRKIEYDRAHAICSKVEFQLRKGKGATRLLTAGRKRKLTKSDLPSLVKDEVLEYVAAKYLKK